MVGIAFWGSSRLASTGRHYRLASGLVAIAAPARYSGQDGGVLDSGSTRLLAIHVWASRCGIGLGWLGGRGYVCRAEALSIGGVIVDPGWIIVGWRRRHGLGHQLGCLRFTVHGHRHEPVSDQPSDRPETPEESKYLQQPLHDCASLLLDSGPTGLAYCTPVVEAVCRWYLSRSSSRFLYGRR